MRKSKQMAILGMLMSMGYDTWGERKKTYMKNIDIQSNEARSERIRQAEEKRQRRNAKRLANLNK